MGAGKWFNASANVSVIRRLVVWPSFILLALTVHLLSSGHQLTPTSATDWFTKGCVILSCLCANACKRSLAICCKSRHGVLLAGFCLSQYSLHVLNRDINMILYKNFFVKQKVKSKFGFCFRSSVVFIRPVRDMKAGNPSIIHIWSRGCTQSKWRCPDSTWATSGPWRSASHQSPLTNRKS